MKKTLLSLIILMTSSIAYAGGFQLQEYSNTNLGRVFGGAGVVGDDYSAIALNPAGMELKDSGLQAGATYIRLKTTMHGDLDRTPAFGKSLANKLLPHFFAQKRINDRWTLGAGIYTPFGLGTYYKDKQWTGSTHAVNSSIITADAALAASFKITNQFIIGASVFAEYLTARLTNQSPVGYNNMNADDHTAPGYSVGIMYRPHPDTRFGISYRSKTTHDIKGTHHFGPYNGTDWTTLVLPEHVLLSAYQKLGKWGIGAMARWTRWSRFSELKIKSTAYQQWAHSVNMPIVDEDWKNVWMIGGGVDYDVNQKWTVRAGLAYDEGGVKRSANRTARAPDTNRWVTGLGASYKSGNWQWDIAYSHVFWKAGRANNKLKGAGTLSGKYHSTVDIVGIGLQYNF